MNFPSDPFIPSPGIGYSRTRERVVGQAVEKDTRLEQRPRLDARLGFVLLAVASVFAVPAVWFAYHWTALLGNPVDRFTALALCFMLVGFGSAVICTRRGTVSSVAMTLWCSILYATFDYIVLTEQGERSLVNLIATTHALASVWAPMLLGLIVGGVWKVKERAKPY